ncbi:MAG: amino acid adenylation domain-containing protein [Verrucomicrobiota bacterium]
MSSVYEKLNQLSPEQRALFEKRMREKGLQISKPDSIQRRGPNEELFLSPAQERLWFVQQFDTENTAYNISSAVRLHGSLDLIKLEFALTQIVNRHESLRTSFHKNSEGLPVQKIHSGDFFSLKKENLTETSNPEEYAKQQIEASQNTPFDLTYPPLRFYLFSLNPKDHILAFVTHHIICDRWSVTVFMRELLTYYTVADRNTLPSLQIQYPDWALWQRKKLSEGLAEKQLAYWKQQLEGSAPQLGLPFRSKKQTLTTEGNHLPITLGSGLSGKIKQLANQSQVSLFTFLLACFKVFLNRYTDATDLVVGSEVANRDRNESFGLIGLLVNTLVIRTQLSSELTFLEVLKQVQENVQGALSHQDLPFEKLVEAINPERDVNQLIPLFQVKFDLKQIPITEKQLGELTLESFPTIDKSAKYDLRFNLQEDDECISGQIEYRTSLFEEATIQRMGQHFINMMGHIVANPHHPLTKFDILSSTEQKDILKSSFGRQVATSQETLHHLFEKQVHTTPHNIAIYDGYKSINYQELNVLADARAKEIEALKLSPESRIGICVKKSIELVSVLLGILKADLAYVPLDPDYPQERLDLIIEDSNCAAIYHQSSNGLVLKRRKQTLNDDTSTSKKPSTKSLAYLIYTSGSTGKPKGVAIEHQAATTLIRWARDYYTDNELQGVLASTSICFDLSIFEIFVPLTTGGSIIVADTLFSLPKLPAQDKVTLINTVPSLLRSLLAEYELPKSITNVNLAGEALPSDLVDDLHKLGIQRVDNLYGPSEDTTYSTWVSMLRGEFDSQKEIITIGYPIDNTVAYILDEHQRIQPNGLSGELYLGGDGLARGYLNREELTETSFIPNPISSQPSRLYRTGDRARRNERGEIEFLGRIDYQFKVRGFRIEAGEIETRLRSHTNILDAVVMPYRNKRETLLLAYLVGEEGKTIPTHEKLHQYLSDQLPSAMIPTLWHTLEEIPRLPNGKVNKEALPQPNNPKSQNTYEPPINDTQHQLVELWQNLLQKEKIGIHDSFFLLGGHSLLAIQLVSKMESHFKVSVPLRDLFQNPTIEAISKMIQETNDALPAAEQFEIKTDSQSRHQPFPLTDIQQAYWLGRHGAFELGNIGTHGYREINLKGIPHEKIETFFNQLIKRHDMLRVIVETDGQQRILEEVPYYKINKTSISPEKTEETIMARREALSHQVFATNQWPLFHLEAIEISPHTTRYLCSFDVLLGDAWSLQILGKEIVQLIMNLQLLPLSLSFRDYVIAEKAWANDAIARRDWAFWKEKIKTLPPAPELPLIKNPRELTLPKVRRRNFKLSPSLWQKLQQEGQSSGLTPSAIILAAFSEILGNWSRHPAFTINLTLFNRPQVHEDINSIVGDFTSSTLIDCDQRGGGTFAERATRVQSTLWQALEHRSVSGVKIIREMSKELSSNGGALMPVVFTSTLGQLSVKKPENDWSATFVYGVSQTSQVYLDHQVSEIDGHLVINWDVIEELWPDGVLDEMFKTYEHFIVDLAKHPECWNKQPLLSSLATYEKLNAISETCISVKPQALLHTQFYEQALKKPNAPAILTDSENLSYEEIAKRSIQLSEQLLKLNVKTNDLIAISTHKGWEQVVACLGILTAGAAYVPISPSLPTARQKELIEDTEAKIVIVSENKPNHFPSEVTQIELKLNTPLNVTLTIPKSIQKQNDLAYVIYTSGSTGMPKGVMIDHRGALNTITDINQRLKIQPSDRIYSISALNFDLSVYDLFGALISGAAIVMGTDALRSEDPKYWYERCNQDQVTIWNSVPALAQLFVQETISQKKTNDISLSSPIRAVLMSGDWIPVKLPTILHEQFPKAELFSLGGATEASIWSIIYPIKEPILSWPSIPYGKPMDNQTWYVLDENGAPRPPWVPGELYIGGKGIALGYWNRPELSAERFVANPFDKGTSNSQYLYRTGDWGRLRPNPSKPTEYCLEFLGREDSQIKINGYRIELGEIEACLQSHPALNKATVIATETKPPELVAYIIPKTNTTTSSLTKLSAKTSPHPTNDNRPRVALPDSKDNSQLFTRQSHRRFLDDTIELETLADLLSALKATPVNNAPFPKYLYPSAGSLYAVKSYLFLKESRVTGVRSGWYEYDPIQHQLLHTKPNNTSSPDDLFKINQDVAQESAFYLFLIADIAKIQESYGDRARDFAHLEAGYLSQLLMEKAHTLNIGFCPANEPSFIKLQESLDLSKDQLCVHSLIGGVIEPSWSKKWMSIESGSSSSFIEKIQSDLTSKLPEYMVPRHFQIISKIPLSPNGKVNHKALPAPLGSNQENYVSPQTTLEKTVAAHWEQLLGVEKVGLHDNFFQLGGNSLQAIQLLSLLRNEGYPNLTITNLFNALTPADQVQLLTSLEPSLLIEQKIQRVDRVDTEVSNLSDENVDAALRKLLNNSH